MPGPLGPRRTGVRGRPHVARNDLSRARRACQSLRQGARLAPRCRYTYSLPKQRTLPHAHGRLRSPAHSPAAHEPRSSALACHAFLRTPCLQPTAAPVPWSPQEGGASALAVRTDSAATPAGLRDLFSVQQAVPGVPVLARDWLIHPLQVGPSTQDATGCSGRLGAQAALGKGPGVSTFVLAAGIRRASLRRVSRSRPKSALQLCRSMAFDRWSRRRRRVLRALWASSTRREPQRPPYARP
jgi:hypothetical protein